MKHALKENDKNQIEDINNSAQIVYYKKLRSQKFNVGDILIKKAISLDEDSSGNPEWKETICFMYNSILPERYLVIAEDDGIYYVKQIMENGKLGTDVDTTCNFEDFGYDDEFNLYEVDPNVIDAVLLETEFDIGDILKEEQFRKARIIETNRTSSVIFGNLKEANVFVQGLLYSLKAGGTAKTNCEFWYHSEDKECFYSGFHSHIKVSGVRKKKVTDIKDSRRMKVAKRNYAQHQLNDRHVFYITTPNGVITSLDLIDKAVYRWQKPVPLSGEGCDEA